MEIFLESFHIICIETEVKDIIIHKPRVLDVESIILVIVVIIRVQTT